MILAPFSLHRPETLDEALAFARTHAGSFDFIAGGTDLLQNYKNRLNVREHVISLERVPELHGIDAHRIGAMERLSVVASHPVIRERHAGLADAIGHVASPLVRNSGTIGGNLLVETRCYYFNQTHFWRDTKGSCMKAESDTCLVIPQKEICYAAYSGDLAPILMVMDASVELAGLGGRRTVKLTEFYRGDGIAKNVRQPDEIIVAISIPDDASTLRTGYRKLRIRDTLDYPEMGCAAAVELAGDGTIRRLRAATTAVDVIPHYADFGAFASRSPRDVIDLVAGEMEERAEPKKNTSMPVGYRKKMVRVYLRRLLHDLTEGRTVSAA